MPETVDPSHLLLIGAGPGVGAGVVRRFGRAGFRSTLISRGGSVDLASELRGSGLEIEAIGADIGDLDGYRKTLEGIFGARGAPASSSTTPPCRTRARSSTPPSRISGPPTTSTSSAPSSRLRSPRPSSATPAAARSWPPVAASPTARSRPWRRSRSARPPCARRRP